MDEQAERTIDHMVESNNRLHGVRTPSIPNNYQKPKKKLKLKRRAGRAIKAAGKYALSSGKNMVRQAPRTAIRFAGKAAGATALGAIGLAAGIATGDPSKAFQNTLTAGGVGYSLGGNLGDRVSTLGEKVTREYGATKNNMKGYDDLEHDDYMTQKEKEFKKTLKANFDKEKVKNMYKDGTINNYIENGVDNVQDIITAEKMREKDSTMSQKKAILIAQYADRVGNEYNGSKAKSWRDTFSDEYQHTAGKNKTESDKAARETMDYIKEFNNIKKTNYK